MIVNHGLQGKYIAFDIAFERSIQSAELAELVDALDSGSSVCKDFRVQVPGSALPNGKRNFVA
jgi:hypothetical protein